MAAFYLLLAAHAVLVMRPSELIPQAGGIHFYVPLIGGATLCALPELAQLLRTRVLAGQPVAACGMGLVVAAVLSHLSNNRLGLAVTDAIELSKAVVYLLLLIVVLTTPQRLRTFLFVTVIAASIMIAASVLDYRDFVGEWSGAKDLMEVYREDRLLPKSEKRLRHVVEFLEIDDENNRETVFRMRGFGIFADPNDVSLLILTSLILSLYFLRDKRAGALRCLWLLNIGMLGYAQLCTQSRGGLVSAAVAGTVFLLMKYGRQIAAVIGLGAVCLLPLVATRLSSFSLSEGTGQERIQLWSDGLVQLTTGKVFFGTGINTYPDISGLGLKAHNSWIHAFVELGVFGGMFFFGLAFFPCFAFYRLRKAGIVPREPILKELYAIVPAIVGGTCFALCALSRNYTPATYMVFGVAAAYLAMVGRTLQPPRPVVRLSQWTMTLWIGFGLALLLASFLFVKTFVRF